MTGPIISLSLPKSGTTTFAEALRHAGLKVADWRIRESNTDNVALHNQLIAPMIYEDYFESGDPLRRLIEFHAITEMNAVNRHMSLWPQTDHSILAAMQRHHSGVRFVLSKRDPGKVARSILNWNNLGKSRLPNADVPGLPRGFGTSQAHLIRWIEGHYTFCEALFANTGRLITYDPAAPETKGKLSAFLGIDLPWWGKANTTENWIKTQRQDG